MTTTARANTEPSTKFGYLIAALVNGALVYVVHNLVEWDVLPFLTGDFDRVVPIITVSLVATMVMNAVYLVFEPPWFKSLTQIALLAISLAATIRIYQVFPFDFSAYEFDWVTVTRVVLVLAMVGVGAGVMVEVGKLVRGAPRR